MAATILTVSTATLSGTRLSTSSNLKAVTTAGTVTIAIDDFSKTIIRVSSTSTTASVALSIGVGTEYSSLGIGAKTVTLATANASIGGLTASTTLIGGTDFESTRFKTSGGTVIITVPALPANTLYIEAIDLP